MKLVVKMKPSMIESELLIGQVSLLKYVHEFKFENKEISFLLAGKSKLHLHEKSPLYKSLYYLSPTYACFEDMTSDYHVEVVDKATGKVDVRYQVLKDTVEMFYLEINTVRAPSLFIFKAPYLVASIGYEHLTKEMKVSININQMCLLKLTPIDENKYEVTINGETLVHLVLGKQHVEIITMHKYTPSLTTIITLKTLSFFENSIRVQLLHKQITHMTHLGWNMSKLAKAFVEVKVIGSGTALLGEYELFHHLNWNLIDIKNMDLMWNSKALITGLPYLKTPLTNDGTLVLKDYVIDMKVVEQLKTKTYTLLFKTKPFKIALLPFFEFP